jgi:hypothetical protein
MGTIATENQEIFNDYENELSDIRTRAQRFDSFFKGRQYSRREKRLMRDYGLMPTIINVVRPLLSNRRAIITSSKPTWRVVPLQSGNTVVADACQQFLVGKWNADYLDIQLNLALKDMLITGFGFLIVDIASFLDNSTFDVNIKHVGWRYIYPDPNAKEFDLSDAENIVVRKVTGVRRAQVLYGLTEEQAAEATGISRSQQQNKLIEVEILDRYSKFPVTRYEIQPKQGEHLRDLPTAFYTSALQGKVEQERRALADEMKRLKVDGKIDLREMRDLNIYRSISVGQLDVDERLMHLRDYPIISFIDEVGDTFKDAVGETEFIEGIQRAINKTYSLMIHNAMLQGNFRVIGPNNAVKDKVKFQKTSNIPGAYLGYEPDASLPDGGKPTIMQSGSLPNAFYQLSGDLIQKAQFETNAYDAQLGNAKGAPETFSTLASLQDFGSQPIKELARRVDVQVGKLGEVVVQFIQNYTNRGELLEFIDLDSGTLASPMMEVNGEKKPIVLNHPVVKDAVVSEIKNNTKIGKYAVRIMTQPNLGTDRLIKAAFIRDMLMNKAIPPTPTVIAMLLKYMEFPNAEGVIAGIQQEQDAAGQVEQLAAALKKKDEEIGMLQNSNMKYRQETELAQFKSQLNERLTAIQGSAQTKLSEISEIGKSLSGDVNA